MPMLDPYTGIISYRIVMDLALPVFVPIERCTSSHTSVIRTIWDSYVDTLESLNYSSSVILEGSITDSH